MILREKPDFHRAIPMPSSSRRSSTALYDRVAAQLRHSLDAGEETGGGWNDWNYLNGWNSDKAATQ